MLSGYRVLIVEDEAIIAQDLSEAITEAEGEVVGPCSGAREARAILKTDARITAAALDVNVGDGTVTPVSGGPSSAAHSNPDLHGGTSTR